MEDDDKEYLQEHGIKIKDSPEEIWHRGSISYFDFSTIESEDGNYIYRIIIPKGTPVQIYLARKYPHDPNFFITEDEVLEAESPEDLIESLNSIGYDVIEIPSELYDIFPTDAKIHWHDKKRNKRIIEGWEANKMQREEYKGEYVTSKAMTYAKRKELEPSMEGIVQQKENNKNKELN